MKSSLVSAFVTIIRLITFQLTAEEFSKLNFSHLAAGIVFTWLVGIDCTLHNSRVESWQHLGLTSVGYIFVLACLLWVVLKPLLNCRISYLNVLTFVALTSPPGFRWRHSLAPKLLHPPGFGSWQSSLSGASFCGYFIYAAFACSGYLIPQSSASYPCAVTSPP